MSVISYIDWGQRIEAIPAELATPRLIDLLAACQAHPHFDLVEFRLLEEDGPYVGIVVDAGDGTVAAQNGARIWPRERLCLSFLPDRLTPAEVRALRTDFPDVLHLNGVFEGQPASLCLYENWEFSERQWTAQSHLRQILSWLEKTADGTLHANDQALEQLFFGNGIRVALPADFENHLENPGTPYYLDCVQREHRFPLLIATRAKPAEQSQPYTPVTLLLPAVEHPPIQSPPSSLGGLEDRLVRIGTSLQPHLQDALSKFARELGDRATTGKDQVLLLLCIPRLRNGKTERLDVRGYIIDAGLEELGVEMGVLGRGRPGERAYPIVNLAANSEVEESDATWRQFKAFPVDVVFMPDRVNAQRYSGIDPSTAEFSGVLAGVGSLGSVLADVWGREGWGRWDYIDPDTIAPHNIVRHEARLGQVGWSKVSYVQASAKLTFNFEDAKGQAIFAKANAFDNDSVFECLTGADLLVDASTTIEVPRDWSERQLPRSASVFLTPSGMCAILLLEDENRTVRLSSLEAQYYRGILNADWGQGHLRTAPGVRVGGGCRDNSMILSNELTRLHGSQLARRLRKAVASPAGTISVWELDDETGEIAAHQVAVMPCKLHQCGTWSVRWDEGLENRIRAIRSSHLPSETGGVLVGVIDQKLRTITLVDACGPPSDSQADETSFTRGKAGVLKELERCADLTQGMVRYVGDWHSHPEGFSARPSGLDLILIATLADRLAENGVPAVMVIVSEEAIGVSLAEARRPDAVETAPT